MGLSLSEYLQRDFTVEQVDAMLIELGGRDQLRFPLSSRAYFHLVLSGTATLKLDDAAQPLQLQTGDMALLLYGAGHTLGVAGVKRPRCIHTFERAPPADEPRLIQSAGDAVALRVIGGELRLGRVLRSAPVNRALPQLLHYSAGASTDHAGRTLLGDLSQIGQACRGAGASAFVDALVRLQLVHALRQIHDDLQQLFPVRFGTPELARVAAVVGRIRAHPEKPWTVAMLAREIGWSRSSFAAKFQAHAGQSPMGFVTRTRLSQAATLLTSHHDMPLWEVARRVGYQAPSAFTRAFKLRYGVSPRRYAAQMAQDVAAVTPHP